LFKAFVAAALTRAEGRRPHLFDVDEPVVPSVHPSVAGATPVGS
jgi:hypothetical protein